VAGDLVLVPSSDHHLYALDLDSGKLAWKFQARAALWEAVAVDEKAAYLASMDHYLYAVSLTNGQRLWEINLDGPMLHAPVLDTDGILYLTTLNEEVIAVNTSSQRVVWRVPIVGKVWNPLLLHEGSLYFGTDEKKVYAIDAATGATSWTNDAGSAIIAAPVLFGDSIAFTTEGGEVFTKTFDGANGWTRTIKGKLNSNPVVVSDRLVVAGVELEHLLVSFDDQGKQDWTYDAPKE
jgi:outer membrane protein assembly factor BamB